MTVLWWVPTGRRCRNKHSQIRSAMVRSVAARQQAGETPFSVADQGCPFGRQGNSVVVGRAIRRRTIDAEAIPRHCRAGGLRHRPGVHAMTGGYSGTPDRQEMIALLPRGRPGCHVLRHRRDLRAPRQRGAGRRGAGPYADRVVIATKFAQDIDPGTRTPRPDAAPGRDRRRGRRVAAADSGWRRSTSTTSTGSTRTCRSRRWPVRSRNWSTPAR